MLRMQRELNRCQKVAKPSPMILKTLPKTGCFHGFEWDKTNFATVDLPWKKIFRRPWSRVTVYGRCLYCVAQSL